MLSLQYGNSGFPPFFVSSLWWIHFLFLPLQQNTYMMIFRIYRIVLAVLLLFSSICLPVCAQQDCTIDIVAIADEIIRTNSCEQSDIIMTHHGMKKGSLGFTTDFKFYEMQCDSAWYAAEVYPMKDNARGVSKIHFISNYNANAVVQSLLARGYTYEEYQPVMTYVSGWYSRKDVKVDFELFPNGGPRYEVTFYVERSFKGVPSQ